MQLNIVSADNHVMEPPGTFVDRVPSVLKERVPRFVQALDGGEGWSWDGTPPASSPVPNTMDTGATGWTWSQIPPGNCDGAAHLADMAKDGIDAAVMYPGMAGGVYAMADREARLACIGAYNDWLLDEFCAADRSRLVGVCLVPTDDERKGVDDVQIRLALEAVESSAPEIRSGVTFQRVRAEGRLGQ